MSTIVTELKRALNISEGKTVEEVLHNYNGTNPPTPESIMQLTIDILPGEKTSRLPKGQIYIHDGHCYIKESAMPSATGQFRLAGYNELIDGYYSKAEVDLKLQRYLVSGILDDTFSTITFPEPYTMSSMLDDYSANGSTTFVAMSASNVQYIISMDSIAIDNDLYPILQLYVLGHINTPEGTKYYVFEGRSDVSPVVFNLYTTQQP